MLSGRMKARIPLLINTRITVRRRRLEVDHARFELGMVRASRLQHIRPQWLERLLRQADSLCQRFHALARVLAVDDRATCGRKQAVTRRLRVDTARLGSLLVSLLVRRGNTQRFQAARLQLPVQISLLAVSVPSEGLR